MEETDFLNLAAFYSADAETLRIKFRQIEHLIGRSHHTTSEGTYCETLLKEFLRRTLPREVSVDGGFIRRVNDADWWQNRSTLPADAPIATPQLDIIIHDTQGYAPLFRSEDLVVVLPDAVRGVIEVKKRLTQGNLVEAVSNIARTTHLLRRWRRPGNRVFTGVFAFSLHEDLEPPSKVISDSFENAFQGAINEYGGDCELPYLTMALPRFALQQSNPPSGYDLCPTTPPDREAPNIAAQFLVFLLSHFIAPGRQGGSLPYPEHLRLRRQRVFAIQGQT